jgi:dinuclear metal center YbgI/SA1388 family protein
LPGIFATLMNVADLVRVMEEIAPTRFAESWDNVGLLVGAADAPLSRVLLTIDCTREVLEEARRERCDGIVSYHPPIFTPQKRFVAGSVAFEAARAGIAIYSPHTALDVADGGTNDVLADAAGMSARAPLRSIAPQDAEFKLVTFVPREHVDAVSAALFASGAGTLGRYTSCSFRTPGTGTFFGEAGTHPAVGQPGRFEEAEELRLEMVVPVATVAATLRALRAAHPYEEPAFDLVRLAAAPRASGRGERGIGRVGTVEPATVRVLADRIKGALGLSHVLAAGALERQVSRVAVCAGSGGELVSDAIASGAELLVTGELRHHDVLRATAEGLAIVCTLHSASERAVLPGLQRRMTERLPAVTVTRSLIDREPLAFV